MSPSGSSASLRPSMVERGNLRCMHPEELCPSAFAPARPLAMSVAPPGVRVEAARPAATCPNPDGENRDALSPPSAPRDTGFHETAASQSGQWCLYQPTPLMSFHEFVLWHR